jgi:hypothetical protein
VTPDLVAFYDLLDRLSALPGQGGPLGEYTGRMCWPARGVYFFREPGESCADERPRIVRVGTHGLGRGSKSKLWGRLRAHRGSVDGRGNHRGSIFRLHVGMALNGKTTSPAPETWGEGQSAPRHVRDGEVEHERRVSAQLGAMPILWVAIPDEPGPGSERGLVERNSIALLSNRKYPVEAPSESWLGGLSPRSEIRESGLWNLNHVDESYDKGFLNRLEHHVAAMERTG